MATDVKKKTADKAVKKESASPVASLVPDIMALLEAGVHFGHERSKRNPKMEKYIFMLRNRIAIFDLEQTQAALTTALHALYTIAKTPGAEILFVGTKRQARALVRKHAEQVKQPYITKRWLGGTLTNFATIQKSIEKLDELKSMEGTPQFDKLTKKEKSVQRKEIERLEGVLEGIKNLRRLPVAVVAVGSHDEKIAIREAKRMNIPVFGLTDTNADPSLVTYPIPANDDAIKSIDMILSVVCQAISAGKAKAATVKVPAEQA